MPALRHTIVDAVCRALAVSDRGFAKKPGNIIEVFVDAGCDPGLVLQAAADAADVRVITEALLRTARPRWPAGVDVRTCLDQGVVAIGRLKSGAWCFAYLDPEDAADHEVVGVSLDLPPHRPVLALRSQLVSFIRAAEAALPVHRRTHEHHQIDEVGSDEDDTFNPSIVDGAPIAVLVNDPFSSETLHDSTDGDSTRRARPARVEAQPQRDGWGTLATEPATKKLAPFADNVDSNSQAERRRHPEATNDDEDDDDEGFFVDATEHLSQPTGLSRPPSKQTSSPSPSPSSSSSSSPPPSANSDHTTLAFTAPAPPLSPTTPLVAKRPTRADAKAARARAAAVPACNTPPPRVREVNRQAALVVLAVVVVVVCGLVAWRFEVLSGTNTIAAEIVVRKDGSVDVGPAQRRLLQQASEPSLIPEQQLSLLSKAIAFDPRSIDGVRAVAARATLLVVLGRKQAAARDLELLQRGLLDHRDAVAAADVRTLENSILSMGHPGATQATTTTLPTTTLPTTTLPTTPLPTTTLPTTTLPTTTLPTTTLPTTTLPTTTLPTTTTTTPR